LQGDGVYTPELVVDGQFGFVGSDGRKASSAIQEAMREPKIPIAMSNVTRDGNQVTVHIEVPRNLPYSAIKYNLGQMLSIWGVSHGKHNFGPFKGNVQIFIGTVPLKQVTVSSYAAYTKPLEKIQLQSHMAIWIVIQKKAMAPTSLPPVTFYTEY